MSKKHFPVNFSIAMNTKNKKVSIYYGDKWYFVCYFSLLTEYPEARRLGKKMLSEKGIIK